MPAHRMRKVTTPWGKRIRPKVGQIGPSEVIRQAMDGQEKLNQRLVKLKSEHKDLDEVVAGLDENRPYDLLQIQRLKKRKLALKDEIAQIESKLLPDIIA